MNILVATTPKDASSKYFLGSSIVQAEIVHYGNIDEYTFAKSYNFIYFRDPFNTGEYSLENINEEIRKINLLFPEARSVDDVRSLDDLLLEDKWHQYELWHKFMPATQVLNKPSELKKGKIAKKRISSRGRDIAFDASMIKGEPNEYILQDRMKIIEEYRVYVVSGEILPMVTTKTSKTESTKVKVDKYVSISESLLQFVQGVISQVNFDFYGLDVAATAHGYFLIEVNRSPQFLRYNQLAHSNIVDRLYDKLVSHMLK